MHDLVLNTYLGLTRPLDVCRSGRLLDATRTPDRSLAILTSVDPTLSSFRETGHNQFLADHTARKPRTECCCISVRHDRAYRSAAGVRRSQESGVLGVGRSWSLVDERVGSERVLGFAVRRQRAKSMLGLGFGFRQGDPLKLCGASAAHSAPAGKTPQGKTPKGISPLQSS